MMVGSKVVSQDRELVFLKYANDLNLIGKLWMTLGQTAWLRRHRTTI
jgi:hypothetical protein